MLIIMKAKHLFLFMALVCLTQGLQAQKYNYYQIFMYNFTRYIQWPLEGQDGDFVIGVMGNSEIVGELQNMAKIKKANGHAISIMVYNSVDDIGKCQMLFIPEGKSKMLDDVRTKIGGQATLLITEKPGLAQEGSGINFIIQDGKLRFELNKAATDQAHLKVSGELSKLAILI